MNATFRIRQICFFYIAVLPVVKFFMMPSLICEITGEDMWISVLINCIADIFAVLTVYILLKNEKCDFFTLIKNRFGKAFANVICILYIVFFLLKAVMPTSEVKDYTEMTLYITSPSLMTFMPVFAIIIYVCIQHLRVIGRISDGIILISLIGYALVFALSFQDTDFGAILPVGAHGTKKILLGSYSAEPWFNDCAYFLFFTGEYVKNKKEVLKLVISLVLAAFIVTFFCIMFYGTFTSIAFRQRFALTDISKYATTINNAERFDYLPIFALLFVSVFSIAMPFYFATELLTRILPMRRWLAALITTAPTATLLIFFERFFMSVENFIINVASGYFLIVGTVLPVVLSVALKINKTYSDKKEKKIEIQGC